jgi:ribonuclease Z
MQLIFLGTSAMVPTKDRNHSSILLRYQNEGIMFDCGEGTQRQLKIAGIKPTQVTKIVISHWDGDHVLGLPGLIQTLAMAEDNKHLMIFGPKGSKKRFEYLFKAFEFYNQIDLEIVEFENGTFLKTDEYMINSYLLEHKVPCYGFEFIEKDKRRIKIAAVKKLGIPDGPLLGKLQNGHDVKHKGNNVSYKDVTYVVEGKKIGFISDTRICTNCKKIAQDKDIVICDSTFAKKDIDKAHDYFHMTSEQAASVAADGNVKKLILTHFSQRYKNVKDLEVEAQDIFPNSVAAFDFMKIKI